MRIQSSKVLEAQMRAVGALPQVMAFSEVYQALQTGVVDGTENPHSNLYTQKMHEVQKHISLTEHGYLGYAVITNKKFWDGLPADVRGQLEKAMQESTVYANKIAKEENDAALEKVKASGKTAVYQPTPAERLDQEGDGQGARGDGLAHRQGHHRHGLQGNRLRPVEALIRTPDPRPVAPRSGGPLSLPRRWRQHARQTARPPGGVADHAAHRRGHPHHLRRGGAPLWLSGLSIPGPAGLAAAAQLRLGAGALHHPVRLDGQVRRRLRCAHRHPRRRGRADQPPERGRAPRHFILFGLLSGALFTGIVGTLGARFVWENGAHYAFFTALGLGTEGPSRGRPRPTWSGRPGSSTRPSRWAPR
jgi:hypothetical protein